MNIRTPLEQAAIGLLIAAQLVALPAYSQPNYQPTLNDWKNSPPPKLSPQLLTKFLAGQCVDVLPGQEKLPVEAWIDSLPRIAAVRVASAGPIQTLESASLPASLREAGYKVDVQRRSISNANVEERTLMMPLEQNLWPGALIQGSSLDKNLFAPIGLPRGGGTVTLDASFVLPGYSGQPFDSDLSVVTKGAVEQARLGLLTDLRVEDSAGVADWQFVYARDLSDAMAKLNVSYKSGTFDGSVEGMFKTTVEQTLIVGKFTQRYYGASFSKSKPGQAWFDPSVDLAMLRTAASRCPVNPPVYLSQVIYGRILLAVIKSNSSQQELEAALDAKVLIGTGKLSAAAEARYKRTLENTTANIIQIGQTGQNLINPIMLDDKKKILETLASAVDAGKKFHPHQNPGAPIAFTARYVGTGSPGSANRGRDQVATLQRVTDVTEVVQIRRPPQMCLATTRKVCDGDPNAACGPQPVKDNAGKTLMINPGDRVELAAWGTNTSGVAFDWSGYPPVGWWTWRSPGDKGVGYPIRNVSPFALIARFGDSNKQGVDLAWPEVDDDKDKYVQSGDGKNVTSAWFYVGNGVSKEAMGDDYAEYGRLWLGTNDNNPYNGNSNLKFEVQVCVDRKDYGSTTTVGKSPRLQ